MIYNKSVYEPVKSEFAERRVIARRKLASRREEVYAKLPRVRDIDTEIETTGLRITKLALSGRGDVDAAVAEIKENTAKLKAERKQLLESVGFAEDYMTNVYACNKCKDTGDIKGEMCECFEKELVKHTFKLSKIAPALARVTFDVFDKSYYPDVTDANGNNPRKQIDNILANCHNFICDFNKPDNKDLLFYGQTGRGKTLMSAVVANEVAKRGHSVMYYTARELFEMLKDNSFSFNEELKEKCKQVYDVDLLIIDDLGSETVNTYTTAAFFDILNARLISGKKMIISSNLNINELKNTYLPANFYNKTEIDGTVETVHVKNTGRCEELLTPGATVYVQKADNPERKTQWDLIGVKKGKRMINMDSQIPNKVVEEWIREGNLFPDATLVKPETTFGNSRFDLYIETNERKIFMEIKGVTLEDNGVVRFPDAPTERGVKHVEELVEAVKPCTPPKDEAKFLTKLFQALRIELNGEMEALAMALEQSLKLLKPGGRLVIMSYHSLEDRLVKNFMRSGNTEGRIEKDFFGRSTSPFVTQKPIMPTAEELERNPRSRSAKLRVAIKREEE